MSERGVAGKDSADPDDPPGTRASRIGLLIEERTNRRLLTDWLERRYELHVGEAALEADGVDLFVVDPQALSGWQAALADRKRDAAPRLLPVLLIRSGSEPSLDRAVWETIDECIETPIRKRKLATRTEVLLRMRRLSLELGRRTEQLELLNHVLHHDIRNDMNAVLGMAELLREYVSRDGERYLDRVLENGEHVVELTTVMWELMEAILADGSASASVSLADVLEAEIENARSAHDGARFRVVGELPDVDVVADDMLESVFRNLLTNAVLHNDVDDPVVTVDVAVESGHAILSVADNGPGIPDDRKDAVFGKGEMGLESDGTGLGLHLVYTLVETYGGAVWIEDNEPEGAVFRVRLPTDDGVQ